MTEIRDAQGRLLFSAAELACEASGAVVLAPGFAAALEKLRLAWDRPMSVTSCCRSAAHNAAVKGHPRSLHVYDAPHWPTGGTAAVDIKVEGTIEAGALAFLAYSLGWSVGVPKGGFVHLDRRELGGLPPKALFGYGS